MGDSEGGGGNGSGQSLGKMEPQREQRDDIGRSPSGPQGCPKFSIVGVSE